MSTPPPRSLEQRPSRDTDAYERPEQFRQPKSVEVVGEETPSELERALKEYVDQRASDEDADEDKAS